MAVPPQTKMHRLLLEAAVETGGILSTKQFIEKITNRLSLTPEDLNERSSSGAVRMYTNSAFALSLLTRAGLLDRPSRGHNRINDKGRSLLEKHDGEFTVGMLNSMAQQREKVELDEETAWKVSYIDVYDDTTPDEKMADSYKALRDSLADDLLRSLSEVSPDNFERLVVSLLEKMGYGKGDTVGRSGDGGIDGIINQDALGLEKVYIQAKRWNNQVGEPEIRNFSGSLDARGASKGVFVTTSRFSEAAKRTAQIISAGSKIIRLIDGGELARLMIDHGVGVITERIYEVKKLDENYFAPEI